VLLVNGLWLYAQVTRGVWLGLGVKKRQPNAVWVEQNPPYFPLNVPKCVIRRPLCVCANLRFVPRHCYALVSAASLCRMGCEQEGMLPLGVHQLGRAVASPRLLLFCYCRFSFASGFCMPVARFPTELFWNFCSSLAIESKEKGLITLAKDQILGTQRYVMEEIARGVGEGIHYFVILKGRQQGITTITQALDLFWHLRHPGMQGTMVANDEVNRDVFKSTFAMYLEGLPRRWKVPILAHNRTFISFANRSRMVYQVAGSRKGGQLGRGKAITYLHGTEVSSWGDEEGLASLIESLAQKNPQRLYVWESTARGPNMFQSMWEIAQKSRTQKAIFVGWWRNEFYRARKGGKVYETYWDGRLTAEEKQWVKAVKQMYGVDIDDTQIAWWRWTVNERIGDETLAYQEHPPTEEYAFVLTGSQFFSITRINDAYKIARRVPFQCYKFGFGTHFKDTVLVKTNPANATLRIWEAPVPGGVYVLGADPAYGSSDWADKFCVQVYRCYSDKLIQVAEFADATCNVYQFAWIICYLAGAYRNASLNLETNGPGHAVLAELRNMRLTVGTIEGGGNHAIADVASNIKHYLWRRPDSYGTTNSLHWLTTNNSKHRMFNAFKDGFERDIVIVHSLDCLQEMKTIVNDEGSIEAPGRLKDDRCVASCLATVMWVDVIRAKLARAGATYGRSQSLEKVNENATASVEQRAVTNYLRKIGIAA